MIEVLEAHELRPIVNGKTENVFCKISMKSENDSTFRLSSKNVRTDTFTSECIECFYFSIVVIMLLSSVQCFMLITALICFSVSLLTFNYFAFSFFRNFILPLPLYSSIYSSLIPSPPLTLSPPLSLPHPSPSLSSPTVTRQTRSTNTVHVRMRRDPRPCIPRSKILIFGEWKSSNRATPLSYKGRGEDKRESSC